MTLLQSGPLIFTTRFMNGSMRTMLAVSVGIVFLVSLAPGVSARTIQQAPTTQISTSASHRRTQRLGALAQSARKLLSATVSRTVPSAKKRVVQKKTPARPTVASRPATSTSVISIASAPAPVAAPAPEVPASATTTLSGDAATVLKLVNEERAKEGLSALVANADLTEAAAAYAADMKNRSFFSHEDPDGRSPEDRIRASGYLDVSCDCGFRYRVGENLAKGQKTPEEVVKAWMESPGHRANILNQYYLEIGIARVGDYWVQEFGRFAHD